MSIIKYIKGDLFQIAKQSVTNNNNNNKPILLAHACNCLGIWGGGIATVFKNRYFSSYELYHTYCHSFDSPNEILGKSLILPIDPSDEGFIGNNDNLLVICLFTSIIGQESNTEIVKNTKMALTDLQLKLDNPQLIENEKAREIIVNFNNDLKNQGKSNLNEIVINMPQINSGIFGVPWEQTEHVLNGSELNINVYKL